LLIRVGGPNAGHQVYAEPAPEKYFHLPSGTQRAPNAQLLLGPGAVIYPYEHWSKKRTKGERIVELAVDYSVPDIREHVRRVVAKKGDVVLSVIT
jgi:adenylosuccinate synthase